MISHLKRGGIALLAALMLAATPMSAFAEQPDKPRVPAVSRVAEQEDLVIDIEAEEEETPAAQPQLNANPRVALMNNVPLRPTSPRSNDLDMYLDSLMATIINDNMSTYGQVKASYDYLVSTMRYGSHMAGMGAPIGSVTARNIYSQYGEVEGYGAVALATKQGMCNAYSSAFILMARKIGLDARLVKGSTKGAGGGYVAHQWAEIVIDGVPYVFDPQLEQDLRRAGLPQYTVFFATYDQIPGRYIKY